MKALIVSLVGPRDGWTMSLIELFWTAKKISSQKSQNDKVHLKKITGLFGKNSQIKSFEAVPNRYYLFNYKDRDRFPSCNPSSVLVRNIYLYFSEVLFLI